MFFPGKADLSGIAGSSKLYVSEALQKVFVEVNEEGSEAAAATFVGPFAISWPFNRIIVDHPFLFMIRDKLTGMLLFQGRVMDPAVHNVENIKGNI